MNHSDHDHKNGHGSNHHEHKHHVLEDSLVVKVGATLFVLTAITVALGKVDLGAANFIVALLVATIKGSLVALFFMGLKYDDRQNAVIFASSFVFLAIFLTFSSVDVFTRGDVYDRAPLAVSGGMQAQPKFKKPWVFQTEIAAHGKTLFAAQCTSCHGAEGKGDGPAAAALNPRPRNFTADEGWKNGRKLSGIFKTLKEGIPGSSMGSFATLSPEDRWALAQYVQSLGPKIDADSAADFAKIGQDTSKEYAVEVAAASLPVEFAMKRLAGAHPEAMSKPRVYKTSGMDGSLGAQVYQAQCLSCHGAQGEGGMVVKTLSGYNAKALVKTTALRSSDMGLKDQASFNKLMARGLEGDLMPSYGHLSSVELTELYQYVKRISSNR